MARVLRKTEAGTIYHVLNRGNGQRMLFSKDEDFAAFLKLLAEGVRRYPVDVLAYCLLGNHWHLLLRPRTDSALSRLMGWLGTTHARRHHQQYRRPGMGHLYQGRFKSFPVQDDVHFLAVARYIEANPVRSRLTERAQEWPWSSVTGRTSRVVPLADWPVPRPGNWRALLDQPLPKADAVALRNSLVRGRPFGSESWAKRIAARLGLGASLKPLGRPPKPLDTLSPRQLRRRLEA